MPLNTRPVGIATQREDLRGKFAGTSEMASHFFGHVAQVRELLAGLGYRALDEVVGCADLLVPARDRADRKATAWSRTARRGRLCRLGRRAIMPPLGLP